MSKVAKERKGRTYTANHFEGMKLKASGSEGKPA